MHLKTVTDAVARVDGLTYPVDALATVKVDEWLINRAQDKDNPRDWLIFASGGGSLRP